LSFAYLVVVILVFALKLKKSSFNTQLKACRYRESEKEGTMGCLLH
jgi:hypothetical protein